MPLKKTTVGEFALKADAPGTFRATFALFDVIDKDRDVTVKGAFDVGAGVRIAQWGHNWAVPAIGTGTIGADSKRAWVDGQFNLEMAAGRETYESVKALGKLQQWSYGFDIDDAAPGTWEGQKVQFLKKLTVHEVSPVMLGAQPLTSTDRIKAGTYRGSPEAERAAVQILAMSFDAGLDRSPKAARAAIAELEHVPAGYKGSGRTLAARVAIELLALEVSAMATPKSLRRKSADGPVPGYQRIVSACRDAGKSGALTSLACRIAAKGLAQTYGQHYALNPDQCDRLANGVLKGRGEAIKRQALAQGDAMFVSLNPHPRVYVSMLGGYV